MPLLNVKPSVLWKTISNLSYTVKSHIHYKVGDGKKISMWYDKWCSLGPLNQIITQRDIYDARLSNEMCISDTI